MSFKYLTCCWSVGICIKVQPYSFPDRMIKELAKFAVIYYFASNKALTNTFKK